MIPNGYFPPAPIPCVHVDCAGDVCRYRPPALGPALPRMVQADGTTWTRYGSLYYGPNNGAGGKVTTWTMLRRAGMVVAA